MSDTGPADADIDEDALERKFSRYMHLLPAIAGEPAEGGETPWEPLDDEAARDRALGCMLGLAVGDAVGAAVAFKPRGSFAPVADMVGGGPIGLAPGEWTSATAMALCLARSLLAKCALDQLDFMNRLRGWMERGENTVNGTAVNVGTTTRTAIELFARTDEPAAGAVDSESAGNGSLARMAPLALFAAGDEVEARFLSNKQSRATHGTIECLDACELFVAQLVDALNGADFDAATRPRIMALCPNVLAINGGEWIDKLREAIQSSGYVVETLEAALWSVARARDFREAVLTAVNLGGDADSVGAVAGQLAGALYGASAIPAEWLEKLAWRDEIERLAGELFALGRAFA
jgi:ADP-ribosyl-[dinitrogen reductase] hydrolase